jgi:hypothetical protein
MSALLPWFKAHWEDVLVGVGVVYVVAVTIANRYTKDGKPIPTWVRAMLDVLSLAPFPFVPAGKKPPANGAAVALLVGALALSACHLSDYARADLAITAQGKVQLAATEATSACDETMQARKIVDERDEVNAIKSSGATPEEIAARLAETKTKYDAEHASWQRTRTLARAAIRTFGAAIQAEAVGVDLARQAKSKLDVYSLLPKLLRLGQDLIKAIKGFGVPVPNIPLLSSGGAP